MSTNWLISFCEKPSEVCRRHQRLPVGLFIELISLSAVRSLSSFGRVRVCAWHNGIFVEEFLTTWQRWWSSWRTRWCTGRRWPVALHVRPSCPAADLRTGSTVMWTVAVAGMAVWKVGASAWNSFYFTSWHWNKEGFFSDQFSVVCSIFLSVLFYASSSEIVSLKDINRMYT